MKYIERLLETRTVNIVIKSETDPGNGKRSLDGCIIDSYTGENLCKLEWYYDLHELLADLDNASRALSQGQENER